ncbi:FAD-binding protein [Kribbella solani]|uniref:BBE domain-containing protein n=1 Tax=Kribbella solani TaxID=236067 RepID=UPI0029B77386|nr:BBE domain-containing protein [Kribbella solani]MDX2970255.1 FAD-binding protein [Kribbella solani]MDX3001948.1 FAD-binding protein [Kribbella solani]
MPVSRRGLLAGTAVAGAALAVPGTASAASPSSGAQFGDTLSDKILPNDARYQDLVLRGTNRRFVGTPQYARVIRSTADAVAAVQDAVRNGKRIAVRGGGHCFEDFVDSSDIEVLLDMSTFDAVTWDQQYRAFSIGAGATLETVYKDLFYGWGLTVPGGGCLGVGVGGHFSGGGYGPLSRKFGSVVDHLYGVEIVVVDAHGRARSVVATRDNAYRDLWWAHTGGGGGNFGVVTRYLMRSAGASGRAPAESLPKAPAALRATVLAYDWKTTTEAGFTRILRNWFDFFEQHNTADSPYATLYAPFILAHTTAGGFLLSTQLDANVPNSAGLMDAFNAAMMAGVPDPKPRLIDQGVGPFLNLTMQRSIADTPNAQRGKYKAGYLRKGYSDAQIQAIHRGLTDSKYKGPGSSLLLVPYGGKVNTVPSNATASAQRNVMAKMVLAAGWDAAGEDKMHLDWLRKMYEEIYKDTGGAPVPNAVNAGSYINYPDADLADPAHNKSGVPWHDLYYLGNYPRLQQVKAKWDPRNVFKHKLSIEPR